VQRRNFIAAVGSATVVGLTGCIGGGSGSGNGNGNGGGGCGTPDDLEGALPDSDDYEQIGEAATSESERFSSVSASFEDADGAVYIFNINKFENPDAVSTSETSTAAEDEVHGEIVADTHLYQIFGPDKESVKELAAASSALDSGCIDANIEWISE